MARPVDERCECENNGDLCDSCEARLQKLEEDIEEERQWSAEAI